MSTGLTHTVDYYYSVSRRPDDTFSIGKTTKETAFKINNLFCVIHSSNSFYKVGTSVHQVTVFDENNTPGLRLDGFELSLKTAKYYSFDAHYVNIGTGDQHMRMYNGDSDYLKAIEDFVAYVNGQVDEPNIKKHSLELIISQLKEQNEALLKENKELKLSMKEIKKIISKRSTTSK